MLKDHDSSYAEGRLKDSVDFCYNEVIRHNLEGASESEKGRLFPFLTPNAEDTSLKELKVPARLYVISMEEFGVEIAAAVSSLKKDGLQSIFKGNSKMQALSDFDIRFGYSDNEIIQVIKKINATMMSLGHALYKGYIYVKPPTVKFTYVLMRKLCVVVGEDLVKFCRKIIEIMSHNECELIPQIRSNWDLIEVKDGYCFSISKRDFIECPIETRDVGKISPRAYAPYYNCKEEPVPLYFQQSIENSFRTCQLKSIFLTNITKA